MKFVTDQAGYTQGMAAKDHGSASLADLWLSMLLFGSIGAIAWAIRGSNGWGGIDGTLVPGLTWGLLWYYLCQRQGIDARGVVLWLGLGLALSGELGYGQYVAWIRGKFYAGDEVLPMAPWLGYVWFAICGLGRGAMGGVILGWVLQRKASRNRWLVRVLLMGVLFVLLFNLGAPLLGTGVIDWLGERLLQHGGGIVFPNFHLGLYAGELDKHLGRTVYTNTQNATIVVWFVIAMLVAALQRDRTTLVAGAIIGGGFGIGFPLSAVWCLGYEHAPDYIDWWKVWELNSGFYLGLLYAVMLHWALRQVDRQPDQKAISQAEQTAGAVRGEMYAAVCAAAAGFVLVFVAGFEYFFWTGLFLATFCGAALLVAAFPGFTGGDPRRAQELRLDMSLAYAAFLLLFILLHGASSRAGVLLELYSTEAIDQYQWPPGRVALFVPAAAALFGVTLYRMRRILVILRDSSAPWEESTYHTEWMIDLLAFIGLVGAVSIWPDKSIVLYALFLCLALFAFGRINRRLDSADRRT